MDWNPKEEKFNWELVFCELYAGGKYNTNGGDNYEYSLGLNGLGSCATQYASRTMDVTVWRDGRSTLHFERGENVGTEQKPLSPASAPAPASAGPDLDVFTDIACRRNTLWTLKRQAVVNAGLRSASAISGALV